MPARKHWIPPLGLAFGQLCHGLSWVLALAIALDPYSQRAASAQIAWIHLVALGWLTTTALSILLHAIPAFLEVRWRAESAARASLAVFALGVAAFVAAFLAAPRGIFGIAISIVAALSVYLATAWRTLAQAFRSPDRIDRAVARAFAVTLGMLALAALLGVASASLFTSFTPPPWFVRLPPAHAAIALFGWLTLLIYGVSARTLRPLTGNRSRRPVLHVISGTATLIGALLLAVGSALGVAAIAWSGAGLIAIGAAAYVVDVAAVLHGSTVTYRVPQAFVASALIWLVVALALGGCILAGLPFGEAFAFAMLAGWAGQMVNGHIFHIGVRLIATIYRGDEDETPPGQLLGPRLPWAAFASMQCAVAAILAGLIFGSAPTAAAGAVLGLGGWIALASALASARAAARA